MRGAISNDRPYRDLIERQDYLRKSDFRGQIQDVYARLRHLVAVGDDSNVHSFESRILSFNRKVRKQFQNGQLMNLVVDSMSLLIYNCGVPEYLSITPPKDFTRNRQVTFLCEVGELLRCELNLSCLGLSFSSQF